MENLREEINQIKENIYNSNIEKRKLNEKSYTLKEMDKKIDVGYNSYKELSDKVDNIKSVKQLMEFKNVNLKNRIPAKKMTGLKKEASNKGENINTENGQFPASLQLKEDFNNLHYNDKMTLESKKIYINSECKELLNKSSASTGLTLFANLLDENKYEIESGFCETMIKAYPTVEDLRISTKQESDLVVIDLAKSSKYIPVMTEKNDYCALIGGEVTIMYKEKINTGDNIINIWHVKK